MLEDFSEKLQDYLDVIIQEKINLKEYAIRNNISIYKNGNMDKGWKGNAVEHLLNLQKNNNATSDYGFLEVKTVPFIFNKNGHINIKETTCLSVINIGEIINKNFEQSSLYNKIKNTLFILINVEDENYPYIHKNIFFDLDKYHEIKNQFVEDYNELAQHILENISQELPEDTYFSGHIGKMIQPRPKIGKNKEYTWAFYMKKNVWKNILIKNINLQSTNIG